MKKRIYTFFLAIVAILLLLFIGYIIYKNIFVKKSEKLNYHAVYDTPNTTVNENDPVYKQKISTLHIIKDPSLNTHVLQQFKSGDIMSISLPSDTEASTSALVSKDIKGIQIVSKDYYINVVHFLHLDNSQKVCDLLSHFNFHKDLYPTNPTKINSSKASAYIWDLSNQYGNTLKQVDSCYVDGKTKAWVVDFYFPQPIFVKKYATLIANIVNGFAFTP